MRIFAINSSPRTGGGSKTELLLNHLLNGMREAGAEVDIVNLREKKLNNASDVSPAGRKPPADVFRKTT